MHGRASCMICRSMRVRHSRPAGGAATQLGARGLGARGGARGVRTAASRAGPTHAPTAMRLPTARSPDPASTRRLDMVSRQVAGTPPLCTAAAAADGVTATRVVPAAPTARRRLALVATTIWRSSHAQHLVDRFGMGYAREGKCSLVPHCHSDDPLQPAQLSGRVCIIPRMLHGHMS